jgi:hypothetical protein
MVWGGPAEQRRDREAGNPDAKDWHDEALKIVEKAMEEYWQALPESDAESELDDLTARTAHATKRNTRRLESEFDRHRRMLIEQSRQSETGGGWNAELRRYLSDLPSDITKKTDVVQWWAVCFINYNVLLKL